VAEAQVPLPVRKRLFIWQLFKIAQEMVQAKSANSRNGSEAGYYRVVVSSRPLQSFEEVEMMGAAEVMLEMDQQ
jgi:hypothetical protein